METDKKHPIGVVERQTGLSTHVIRKWEERYNAIEPERNSNGRRFYSSNDIYRLNLLKRALETGRSIGQVVHLSNDMLNSYIDKDKTSNQLNSPKVLIADEIQNISKAYLAASKKYMDDTMADILNKAYVEYGQHTMIDEIITCIMHTVGNAWHLGEIRIMHEHLATLRITSFLMKIFDDQKLPNSAPVAISATLYDQSHTIGSLLGAIIARDTGWKSLYLGGNIPAAEIAMSVKETGASALILSFNYPYNKLNMHSDLSLIKSTISDEIPIIIGGDPALLYKKEYNDTSFTYTEGFSELRSLLQTMYLNFR